MIDLRDHETKTYETETSTSWDRGRDQDQLLWDRDRDQKSGLETTYAGLETLTSLIYSVVTEDNRKC